MYLGHSPLIVDIGTRKKPWILWHNENLARFRKITHFGHMSVATGGNCKSSETKVSFLIEDKVQLTLYSSYEHKILGSKASRVPVETGGGILADDMGLGKTLTVLSTIIRTANEAKAFAEKESNLLHQQKGCNGPMGNITSKSTLVLCPSPCKL